MSALGDLFSSVRDSFSDSASSVVFGEREPSRQDNQSVSGASRICFVPCDGDAIGDMEPGKEGNLGALRARATVYVWAHDPDNPEDELAQYEATRDLFCALFIFMWKRMAGSIKFGAVSKVRAIERLDGTEWKMSFTLRDDLEFEEYTTATDLIPAPRFVFQLPGTGA